ncbi:MAG: hypothetical protein OHK0029_26500 [Armatimonadaceae bacterium]
MNKQQTTVPPHPSLPSPPAPHRNVPAVATTEPSLLYYAAKRCLDIAGSLVGLVVLAPLFLYLALRVRHDSAGAIIYRRRVLARQKYESGERLQTFDAYKFRTMIADADDVLHADPELLARYQKEYKLPKDPRVTLVGVWMRPLCLDELPQLVNVLRGQMTLVGPRMITEPELENYAPHQATLLQVKPGLTGLWQVRTRTDPTTYAERVQTDLHYIATRSFWGDLQILLRTVHILLQSWRQSKKNNTGA